MNYVEFIAGEKTYKLRLNTKGVLLLEKSLKQNPVTIFGANGREIPTVSVLLNILHASLQAHHPGTSPDEAYEIFDAWLEDGHIVMDFLNVVLDVYRNGGLVKKEEQAKN